MDAAEAADAVHVVAVAIMDADMRPKHAEALAAIDILRKLEEELSGFHILDSARPGGPKFTELKAELVLELNRQVSLRAKHADLREPWRLRQHIDGLNADARQRWQDYHGRLCANAEARFDHAEESAS
jgi:hypothetical protein